MQKHFPSYHLLLKKEKMLTNQGYILFLYKKAFLTPVLKVKFISVDCSKKFFQLSGLRTEISD